MFNQQKANKIARKIFRSDNDNIFAIKYRPEEAFLLAHAFKDGLSFIKSALSIPFTYAKSVSDIVHGAETIS